MKGIETLDEKQGLNDQKKCRRNKYIKVIKDLSVYVLKGLSVVVGFTIALFSFTVFMSVAMAIATVCGLGYALCEVACNLKDLSDKVFGKQDNVLDDYYDMQKFKDLESVMNTSKDVQDYLAQNNLTHVTCRKTNEQNRNITEEIDKVPKIVELPDNSNALSISQSEMPPTSKP